MIRKNSLNDLEYREHLIMMRYKICASFPLLEIIKFHKAKEQEMARYQENLRS
jgi:hypothetical protein